MGIVVIILLRLRNYNLKMKTLLVLALAACLLSAASAGISATMRSGANCPSRCAIRGVCQVQGYGNVEIRNVGSTTISGPIILRLCDEMNHCNYVQDNYRLKPREVYRRSYRNLLQVTYYRYGSHQATSTIEVAGAPHRGLGRCQFV